MMPAVTFERISKRFPGVTALADVSFSIAAGECHAIVGENGAGKSTLGKIVAGICRPDGGRVLVSGAPVTFRSPIDAARAGISIVHQELAFCRNLSIQENLFLGQTPAAGGFVRWREMRARAGEMLGRVGLDVAPSTPMERLSTGQEQMVQIAVAIGRSAKIIVMDEPTSSLSTSESDRLFEILAALRREGVTVLYVSHRMTEILRLSDRVTVLRDGCAAGTLDTRSTTPDEIVQRMIGRPVEDYFSHHGMRERGAAQLEVRDFSGPTGFRGVSFDVRAGEIVGLAGLVGAGRSELARAIFGVDRASTGELRLGGRRVEIHAPLDAIRLGLGLLPEDRKLQGLVLSMTCKENLTLALLSRMAWRGFIHGKRERALAGDYMSRLRVRAPGLDAPVAGLSGGNQQKISLAKWLARECSVLILDEPTRGVDVGAKAEIHAWIDRLAGEGRAILLISSDLPELLNLSTRVLVMAAGRLVGELSREQADPDTVLRLMANVGSAVQNSASHPPAAPGS